MSSCELQVQFIRTTSCAAQCVRGDDVWCSCHSVGVPCFSIYPFLSRVLECEWPIKVECVQSVCVRSVRVQYRAVPEYVQCKAECTDRGPVRCWCLLGEKVRVWTGDRGGRGDKTRKTGKRG